MSEVFLTDAVALGDGDFLVAVQWPRDHALYNPNSDGSSDPLLFAETIRQTSLYLGHQVGIPLGHHFVGSALEFEVMLPEALCTGTAPLSMVLEARWTWRDGSPAKRFALRLDVVLIVDGQRCGRGSLEAIAVDSRRYRLLRGRESTPSGQDPQSPPGSRTSQRLPARLVGRLREKDSVLAPAAQGGWQAHFDIDHPILFDHPTDHVPMMALLEGFRQLGHLLTRKQLPDGAEPVLGSLDVACLSFGDLGMPVDVEVVAREALAAPRDGTGLTFRACQRGRVLATADSTWIVPNRARENPVGTGVASG